VHETMSIVSWLPVEELLGKNPADLAEGVFLFLCHA
jgi:hypothetical protein